LVRQFVRQVLDDWGIATGMSRHAMIFLASELASNAVEHAGNGFSVSIRRSADLAHVEVCDADATLPTLREPSLESERGRGLMIMDRVACAWGAEPAARGKVVWFELSLVNSPAIPP
jgi:anti-sigma regulatory factor (Ser/Thr protein kinase)